MNELKCYCRPEIIKIIRIFARKKGIFTLDNFEHVEGCSGPLVGITIRYSLSLFYKNSSLDEDDNVKIISPAEVLNWINNYNKEI